MEFDNLKIAIGQINIIWEDKEKNKKKCEKMVRAAAKNKADLIIFPEMTLTGFSMDINKISEQYNQSPTINFFKKLAKENKISIIFGMVLKSKKNDLGQNTAITIDRLGKIIAKYKKIHPFSFVCEDKFYEPGNKLSIFKIKNIKAAVVICYDLRFPGIFEALARHKIELIIVIANWPKIRIKNWESLLLSRSLDTQSYIIGVNRFGNSKEECYDGNSLVYLPSGIKLVQLNKEQLGFVNLNNKIITDTRKQFPSLNDKRHKLYLKL